MSEAETDISTTNGRKLDRVITLLEGDGESVPGVLRRLATHEEVLFGRHGSDGLVNKVSTMWRVHVWILCSLSGALGFGIKSLVEKIFKP